MRITVLFAITLLFCACNSQKKLDNNIITFEGINIETDINSFCNNMENKGYEKIDVPNSDIVTINSIVYYGKVANTESTINIYKDSLSQSISYIKAVMLLDNKEDASEKINNIIKYFKEGYPNAEFKTLNEGNNIEYYFLTLPILVCISSIESQDGTYNVFIDYDNTSVNKANN